MGREAECHCTVGTETAWAKVLLESDAILLRGAVKRRFGLGAIEAPRVVDGRLHFSCGAENVALELGEPEALRWLKKLGTPPPSLASKLGVGPERRAWVSGPLTDPALAAALRGAQTADPRAASILVAVVSSQAELDKAVALHSGMDCKSVWIVHPKGRDASLTDAEVRSTLRAHAYRDNKTSAVSEALTATRYTRS